MENKIYKQLKVPIELLEDEIEAEEIPHNFLSPYLINIDKMEDFLDR